MFSLFEHLTYIFNLSGATLAALSTSFLTDGPGNSISPNLSFRGFSGNAVIFDNNDGLYEIDEDEDDADESEKVGTNKPSLSECVLSSPAWTQNQYHIKIRNVIVKLESKNLLA